MQEGGESESPRGKTQGFSGKALQFCFASLSPPIRPGEIPRKKPTAV